VEVLTAVDSEAIRRLVKADSYFWLDLYEPSHDDLERLGLLLGLHPAAVEDTREWEQLPKLDDYHDHVLLVFFTAERSTEEKGRIRPLEVHVYISGHWIVTARHCQCRLDHLHPFVRECDVEDESEVLYHVLDALADGWDPVIDEADRRVDVVETAVLERPRQSQLRQIYHLKQDVSELLRHAAPQSEIFPGAMETLHELPGLTHGERAWLRDVEGHLNSITSDLRRIAGDLHALTDSFFNANANRLNRLATVIAVASVFFLVWTLVTSFFGQNFGWLVDHIKSERSFLIYGVGGMVVPTIVLAVVAYWRRGDWW
jgi:magnesium transporter